MRCVALALAGIVLALAGCTSATATSSRDGAVGVCVEDSRKPAGCQTKWTLVDPCSLSPSAAVLQAAVFDGQCPPDAALSAGNLSLAIQQQSVAPDKPIVPEQGLDQKPYGFAFLLRDQDCHVIAWGCTTADLGAVTEIKTNVKNWSGQDLCTAATGGGCTAPATCNVGVCQ